MKKTLLLIVTIFLTGYIGVAQGALDISIIKTGEEVDEDDPNITFDVSTDDAEQENVLGEDPAIDALFDDDIDAGWEGEEGDANILIAGLRFQNLMIPQGATIDSAFFVVVSHEAKAATDVANLTIYAEATDDALTFTEDALITDRVSTTATVDWTVDEEWGLWTTERSADVSTVLQEIVDRDGWESGNSVAFVISGENQGPSEVENAREWQSFENIADPEDGGNGQNYPERAPRLIVYYDGYDGDPIQVDRGINSFARGALDVSIIMTESVTEDVEDENDVVIGTVTFDGSSDDAEQENDEIDALFDDDIDAGWEGEEGDANTLTAGLRFQDVQLPQNALIDSAFLVVVSHEAKAATDVAMLTIYAEAADSASTFTEDALITDRVSTEAQVEWTVDEEWGLWTTERSVDISPVIQEIVERDGWKSGNAIALVVAGEDQGPSEVENAREWQSFENIADPEDGGDGQNYPERAPRLVVYYGGYEGTPIVVDRGINSFADALSVTDDSEIAATIYPNPAVADLNLVLPSTEKASISLTTIEGKLVRTFSNNGLKEIKINLSYLKEGIYLIAVDQAGSTFKKKFIVK